MASRNRSSWDMIADGLESGVGVRMCKRQAMRQWVGAVERRCYINWTCMQMAGGRDRTTKIPQGKARSLGEWAKRVTQECSSLKASSG
jgi:hypothetical protein